MLDAAPIIVALELGYFRDESLSVVLDRQIGWGNVRDKLTFGHLHASQALLGMPAASVLGMPQYPEPLVGLLSLGFGGNAITLSRRLTDGGVENATTLATWVRSLPQRQDRPLFAHVFGASTHHYLLRDWLSASQIDPDRDVRLCVLPPQQMVGQLSKGYLDGFCVGEPWNTVATDDGCGKILEATTNLVPEHPEKLLAVTRRWLNENTELAERIARAMLYAGEFCGEAKNRARLCEILARPEYLAVNPDVLQRSLAFDNHAPLRRSPASRFYGVSATAMFPSASHIAWLLSQMKRWNHLPSTADIRRIASKSIDTTAYRAAALAIGIDCPADDFPPMRLRNGWFTVQTPALLPT